MAVVSEPFVFPVSVAITRPVFGHVSACVTVNHALAISFHSPDASATAYDPSGFFCTVPAAGIFSGIVSVDEV